jgi:hypothetical protein
MFYFKNIELGSLLQYNMNSNSFHRDWHSIRIKLKQKFPQLTFSDLHDRGGDESDFIHMVAHKLKISSMEVREIISKL